MTPNFKSREEGMKKYGLLQLAGLLTLSSCATVTVPKTALTPSELYLLKGEWEGVRVITWDRIQYRDFTVLEIFNDSVPLKGKITFPMLEAPYARILPFENGFIDGEGNLPVQVSEFVKINMSLHKEEKKIKLGGYYWHRTNQGTLTLYKK
jgi:hypothetical protein